jgi:ribosomal protein S18 acetylase RimI-like enzyme
MTPPSRHDDLRVRLEPMTWDQFDVWAQHSVLGFAEQQVSAGLQPRVEATTYARQQFAELLPSGLATPLHLHWTVHERVAGDPVVGYLWLRVRTLSTEVEAFVFDVEVLEEARGRGLGRATMQAAEQAARELDASVVRLNVFGHNTAALRLYESLGYVVTSLTMTRLLDEDPVPRTGPVVQLEEMTDAEYAVLRPRVESDYAADIVRSGALPRAEATRKAAADLDHLLPDGPSTSGHLLRTGYVDGQRVGGVWLQLRERSDGIHAFGLELEVVGPLRGRGYGRALVEAALEACRERGARSVALSVFGFNTSARQLYASAGFGVTAQTMAKQL